MMLTHDIESVKKEAEKDTKHFARTNSIFTSREKHNTRAGPYTGFCNCKSSYFKSACIKFPVLMDKQLYGLEECAESYELVDFSPDDAKLTEEFRRKTETLAGLFNMDRLKQRPMFAAKDGYALLLPHDNKYGWDYFPFRYKGLWAEKIARLQNKLWPLATSEKEREQVLLLATDYSMHAPYAATIRKDGTLLLTEKQWPTSARKIFRKHLSFHLNEALKTAEPSECLPALNVTKSLGFFDKHPDGSKVDRGRYAYVPEGLDPGTASAIHRYNYGPVKLEWMEKEIYGPRLALFLNACREEKFDDIYTVMELFKLCYFSVHTEAYRINNADVPLIDVDAQVKADGGWNNFVNKGGFVQFAGKWFKKNRAFGYETKDGKCAVGKIDDKKMNQLLRQLDPEFLLTANKKRPMYPGPNGTFSPAFIVLFRLLMHQVEKGPTSFPSTNTSVMDRYNRNFAQFKSYGRLVYAFDRSNAEQFISDNKDFFFNLLPKWLYKICDGLMTVITPSTNGPRITRGGMPSGTAVTTFANSIVGSFENLLWICYYCGVDVTDEVKFNKVCGDFVDCIFNGKDYFTIGDYYIPPNLGTDDQVGYIFCSSLNDEQMYKKYLDLTPKFCEGRSLGFEEGTEFTVFGLKFTRTSVVAEPCLGLSKLFLMENTTISGDALAFKLMCRLEALPKYYETIRQWFLEEGLGSIEDYKVGADRFLRMLVEFGYPVEGYLNEYNPEAKLRMGEYFEKAGIDPRKSDKQYPVGFVEDVQNIFVNFANEYNN